MIQNPQKCISRISQGIHLLLLIISRLDMATEIYLKKNDALLAVKIAQVPFIFDDLDSARNHLLPPTHVGVNLLTKVREKSYT